MSPQYFSDKAYRHSHGKAPRGYGVAGLSATIISAPKSPSSRPPPCTTRTRSDGLPAAIPAFSISRCCHDANQSSNDGEMKMGTIDFARGVRDAKKKRPYRPPLNYQRRRQYHLGYENVWPLFIAGEDNLDARGRWTGNVGWADAAARLAKAYWKMVRTPLTKEELTINQIW